MIFTSNLCTARVLGASLVLLALTKTTSAEAADGRISSGGGRTIVCRTKGADSHAGLVQSARLLDLAEAELFQGYKIPRSSETMEDQLGRALAKLETTGVREEIAAAAERIRKVMRPLPSGVLLEDIDDSYEVLKFQCPTEQAFNYYTTNQMFYVPEILEALDNTDSAALIAHEAVYEWDRKSSATDSRRTRRIVGFLFSDQPPLFVHPMTGVPQGAIRCRIPEVAQPSNAERDAVEAWLYKQADKYRLQFIKLGGVQRLTKTTVDLNLRAGKPELLFKGMTEAAFEGSEPMIVQIAPESFGQGKSSFQLTWTSATEPGVEFSGLGQCDGFPVAISKSCSGGSVATGCD